MAGLYRRISGRRPKNGKKEGPKDKQQKLREQYQKKYFQPASKKLRPGEAVEHLGHALALLGKSRKEARRIFLDYFSRVLGFKGELLEANVESALRHQFDPYDKR